MAKVRLSKETSTTQPISRDLLDKVLNAAWERRAFDTTVLQLGDVVGWTDYMVVLSGRSSRHVKAIAEYLIHKMKEQGVIPLGSEGLEYGRWVVLDYQSVVVHIFLPELRELYDLEGLWGQAPRVEVDEPEWVREFAEEEGDEEEPWES